ncbi:hypothetical protein [Mycetocola zhujimingii]|uniref:DUF1579 domain-containing protein n=1 Tax=Mycetocola zhujimingii TaxID=2079792 RepID=A0A2U1TBS9_9MICO|nr:hypothetical protein [Mycetocola zhujimingii]AWB87478.1 hypothetical protein C3E77_13280 [Mycetocola zhujimingii]PWC06260.1 hypothetical protein DF223_11675 [Mycetocola zhujimingii]
MSDPIDLSFADALISDAATERYPNRMSRFGRLVGRWNVHSRRMDEATGNWHESDFVWVVGFILDGKAVQDVALTPTDGGFETIATAVRVYDRDMGAWRVSYFEPERGEYAHLVATAHKRDGIRQDGTRNDGLLIRWNFSKITDHSYQWESFVSEDEGTTWVLNEHNEGIRVS